MTSHPPDHDGGDHLGGGPRTERAEGSFTDGGSLAGQSDEARSFGAGRAADASRPGATGTQGEGGGSMSGRGQEDPGAPRGGEPPPDPHQGGAASEGVAQGLATPLQPGGLTPGGGPGATQGSLGTGGGSDANRDTGSVKRDGI